MVVVRLGHEISGRPVYKDLFTCGRRRRHLRSDEISVSTVIIKRLTGVGCDVVVGVTLFDGTFGR